jgi:predicted DNA-binding protein with PD1-like motif
MQSEVENNIIVIKLDNGENLFEALGVVIEKHKITSGLILSGIGMLKDLEIGYYNGQNYIYETFVDPMELLSMHGSIANGDESKLHIHVSLASSEHMVYGGHLNRARVCVLNEIVILRLNEITVARRLNEKSGLLELEISK